jgi:GNAT superfamily N-acetyltransferase
MDYILRKAELADHPMLLAFEQGIINAERPYDPTLKEGEIHYYDLKELIFSENAEVLVVEYNGEVIASGYAKIKIAEDYFIHSTYSYLGFMYVNESHRGKGVNKIIIDGLVNWSKNRGLTEIRLQVYDDNESALKAYEKVGFKKHMVEMRMITK